MRQLKFNQTYYKVLLTIKLLNDLNYYPLNEGVFKILSGKIDDETERFSAFPTFGTLSSFTNKKISHLTLMLFRHGYINKIFDSKRNKLYFRITEFGEQSLDTYGKKHKLRFSHRKTRFEETIVKIDD
ncbi:MAG TPA: hypothetical protein GX010_04010 [Erysipelotrichaceae bacterium]|nr:hypothetical protein [Erysipelotrichaceae bacterium]